MLFNNIPRSAHLPGGMFAQTIRKGKPPETSKLVHKAQIPRRGVRPHDHLIFATAIVGHTNTVAPHKRAAFAGHGDRLRCMRTRQGKEHRAAVDFASAWCGSIFTIQRPDGLPAVPASQYRQPSYK